ncbi:ribonuclease H-like domain-containing protein [Tanacetum coccineum]
MRTKPGVDTLSFDDLYNNLRVFESDIKGSTASSSSTQNYEYRSKGIKNAEGEMQGHRNKAKDNRRRPGKQEEPNSFVILMGRRVDWTLVIVRSSDVEDKSCVETLEFVPEPVVVEPKVVSQPKVWSDAPIIEEYESDSDDEYVIEPSKRTGKKLSFAFVYTVKHVKTPRETVKEQNTCSPSPKLIKRDWNGSMSKRLGLGYDFTKKACFVCGSFGHLIRDCDFHEKRMAKQVKLNKKKGRGTGQGENRPALLTGNMPTLLNNKTIMVAILLLEPITAGPKEANQSAGTQDTIDAGNSQMETEPAQKYFVLPVWSSYTSTVKSSEEKNGDVKPNGDNGLKTNEKHKDQGDQAFLEELERLKRQEKEANDAAKVFSANYTNIINTVSTSISTASPSNVFSAGGPDLNNNDQDDS